MIRHVALTRRTPFRVKPKIDHVTPQVRAEVIARDLRIAGGCVAPFLDATAGECKDRWGNLVRPYAVHALTLNHVREHSGGERRSQPRWLITLCWGHGVQSWELRHVEEQRRYLAEWAR